MDPFAVFAFYSKAVVVVVYHGPFAADEVVVENASEVEIDAFEDRQDA